MPGPVLLILWAAAAALLTLTGAFGTDHLAGPRRLLFWSVLIGWNGIKWQLWMALMVRDGRHWQGPVLLGAVLLNAVLPVEISAAYFVVGIDAPPSWGAVYISAVAISAIVYAIVYFVLRSRRAPAPAADTAVPVQLSGLAARIGPSRLGGLIALQAEDHYCRAAFADGSSMLVHYRFGDALADLRELGGEQVHRGTWVRADAVRGAVRDGRRWRLVLSDGSQVPVSASFTAIVRRRGWLTPAA